MDETYYWYRDVPNVPPANYSTVRSYFSALTDAKTPSGQFIDLFSYSVPTAEFNASNSGVTVDYGIEWLAQSTLVPRKLVVAYVNPGSPAALAGVKRGDRLTRVDGIDFVNDNTSIGVDKLLAGLFPVDGRVHNLEFNASQTYSMGAREVDAASVQSVKTFPLTRDRTVGYFRFDAHLARSEAELVAAINQLKAAQVTELVLDMRYNGGGLLYIASQLAYMIAGDATNGKRFEAVIHNDKRSGRNFYYPFYATTAALEPLPTLGLRKVTLLVSNDTASASESLINGLRGVDVQVNLVGDTTRGKPYGSVPQHNCGTTYLAIQFEGVNHKWEGGYVNGFAATCSAPDDLGHELGSSQETMLKSALWFLETGSCPAVATAQMTMRASSQKFAMVRSPAEEARIVGGFPAR